MTDSLGAVVSRRDFFPFGEQIDDDSSSGRLGVSGYNDPVGFKQMFTGKERDEESGLDYFLARYYSPGMGRFTGVDPGGANAKLPLPQTWNAYAYGGNSPLRLIDPDGRQDLDLMGGPINHLYSIGVINGEDRQDAANTQQNLEAGAAGAMVAVGGAAVVAEVGVAALAAATLRIALARAQQLGDVAVGIFEAVTGMESGPGSAAMDSFSRALTPADLGVKGTLRELSGTFALDQKTATVTIKSIEGNIKNPLEIVGNLVSAAKEVGAETLRIEGTLANPKLLKVLEKRYQMATEGGSDFIELAVE